VGISLPNTPDLALFRELHFRQGWRVNGMLFDIMAGRCSVELEKDGGTHKIESQEPELLIALAHFKQGYGRDGVAKFTQVKSIDSYENDLDSFIDEDNTRLRAAVDSIRRRETPIDTPTAINVVDALVFKQDYSVQNLQILRTHYFDIQAHNIVWLQANHTKCKVLYQKLPKSGHLADILGKHMLNRLLPRFHINPLETIRDFNRLVDVDHQATRIMEQQAYYVALMQILSTTGTVPGADGVRFLSDIYRRFAELSRPFVQALIQLDPQGTRPKKLSYDDEVEWIKKMGLGDLARNLEPKIRNSEAHVSTEIRAKEQRAIYRSTNGEASRSFKEIAELADEASKGIVPSLLSAFQMTRLCLVPLLLRSAKFKLHLVVECQRLKRDFGQEGSKVV
jgi:hypothetical protein